MTGHLSFVTLSALADGELSAEQLASASEHLAGCPVCTAEALSQSLLKSATARSGRRHTTPLGLEQRLKQIAAKERASSAVSGIGDSTPSRQPRWSFASLGWLAAAAVLLIAVSVGLMQHRTTNLQQNAALITEVCDQHIAMLAAGPVPQVISTDRHTVKPWFQGRIPFSFNLPENLPANTTLDGANLSYLGSQPVAQLLYSIGKHRVSVFVRERPASAAARSVRAERSGFHVESFDTDDLEVIAVSDVDPARLRDLVAAIRLAQTGASPR